MGWLIARLTGLSPMVWLVIAAITAGAGALGTAYFMGKAAARAEARIAELELTIKGQAELIARYESAKAAAEELAREEVFASAALEAELDKLRAEIAAEREKARAESADLEADLAKMIQDKESLNAILDKLRRRAPPDCTATDRDVDLDKRLRGENRGSP